jgi:hypothetical protein
MHGVTTPDATTMHGVTMPMRRPAFVGPGLEARPIFDQIKNGFVRFSLPIVVGAPWPE